MNTPADTETAIVAFRKALSAWWDRGHRALPWRESNDFYRVWLSEIMLQQTRVEAVKPYFEDFLSRFPTIAAVATASETEILTAWSGLGYYSRARNFHRAAKQIVANGLPATHNAVLAMPGIGPYTAAAISSIALGLPHAAVDGNVVRVIARLDNDSSEISSSSTMRRIAQRASELLDSERPGDFNQAMMELGATVCTPRNPACGICPVASFCSAQASGTQNSLPVNSKKPTIRELKVDLLVMEREGSIFLVQRKEGESRLAGFWEIPQRNEFPKLRARRKGAFTHQIVNDRMRISVWHTGEIPAEVAEGRWFAADELKAVPLTTASRKGLDLLFPS